MASGFALETPPSVCALDITGGDAGHDQEYWSGPAQHIHFCFDRDDAIPDRLLVYVNGGLEMDTLCGIDVYEIGGDFPARAVIRIVIQGACDGGSGSSWNLKTTCS